MTEARVDWEIQASPSRVDVWSERRLQFNSKPETVALRTAIGEAVGQLRAEPGQILSATLTSAAVGLVDAENVLFYNVGAARFREASREGLRFERVHAAPERARHHHCYQLVPRFTDSRNWRRLETLAACSVPIPPLNEQSKPDAVWLAVRKQVATGPAHTGPYGLKVTLTTPRPVRLASLLKPLLDGIISGLHFFQGSQLELLSARLAGRLGQPSEDIARALTTPAQALLGGRQLLRNFGEGIQWNPADDACVTCTLLGEVSRDWHLDFEFFSVEAL